MQPEQVVGWRKKSMGGNGNQLSTTSFTRTQKPATLYANVDYIELDVDEAAIMLFLSISVSRHSQCVLCNISEALDRILMHCHSISLSHSICFKWFRSKAELVSLVRFFLSENNVKFDWNDLISAIVLRSLHSLIHSIEHTHTQTHTYTFTFTYAYAQPPLQEANNIHATQSWYWCNTISKEHSVVLFCLFTKDKRNAFEPFILSGFECAFTSALLTKYLLTNNTRRITVWCTALESSTKHVLFWICGSKWRVRERRRKK